MNIRDTVAAISTPPGRGGIGIIRLSGPESRAVSARILRFRSEPKWTPWSAALAELVDADGNTVDHVVVTFFAGPRSYTGEDVIEISCHGSPVVLRHCLERACSAGARLAEPGEFTLRAFLNGRIDLLQAEAVRDLIESTTLYQARVAARQAEGSVSRRLSPRKAQLLELIALLEAGIDFAEDDVSVAGSEQIIARLLPIEQGISKLAASFQFGKLVHAGFTLAIVGRPNVGKSSLFNRLVEQDRAIVTDIPGTTRDLVSESAAIEGIPVRFVDTAGIRSSVDLVEKLGVERSYEAMADADLTLVILDLSAPVSLDDIALVTRARQHGRYVVIGNKCDIASAQDPSCELAERERPPGTDGNSVPLPADQESVPPVLRVSALTGEGIDELRDQVLEALAPGRLEQDSGFITSVRHERLLRECLEYLQKARIAAGEGIPHEMLLLDLYGALQALDAITGATTADDILNRIFSTFCIGK